MRRWAMNAITASPIRLDEHIDHRGDSVLREGEALVVALLWGLQEIIANTWLGLVSKSWQWPDDGHQPKQGEFNRITVAACIPLPQRVPVSGEKQVLSPAGDEGVSIVPAGAKLVGRARKGSPTFQPAAHGNPGTVMASDRVRPGYPGAPREALRATVGGSTARPWLWFACS